MAVVTEGKTGSCEVLATIYLLTFHSPPNSYQRKYCLAMVASHEGKRKEGKSRGKMRQNVEAKV